MPETISNNTQKWGVFEVSVEGSGEGNPFLDRTLLGTFTSAQESVTVEGFYDGDGIYRARFMPSFEGEYTYQLCWKGKEEKILAAGTFLATAPGAGNHGSVHVANTFHFAYADGTPYFPIGTTCYVWELQSDERIEQTLKALQESAFNKIRFCVFPKHYDYNLGEPRSYPYEGTPMDSSVLTKENFQQYNGKPEGNHFDYLRPNPAHFRHIEKCILALQELGIEADLIVMHPYDRWGFSQMNREEDTLYWRYVLARFAAYRNVWWSLANEYDLFDHKTTEDWEYYADLIVSHDPYRHLRSIHNCRPFYDHNRPWITHCSIQRQDLYKTSELVNQWREAYQKPIVLDEIAYEGNIQHGWGNISGEEMTRRFWEAVARGGYPGHGETYMHPSNILWWSHGGELHGESHKRFHLLKKVLEAAPAGGLAPWEGQGWDEICAVPEREFMSPVKSYYLFYYSFMRPSFREYHFDEETNFQVTVIDTWEMTTEDRGIHRGKFQVELPGKPYMAVLVRRT